MKRFISFLSILVIMLTLVPTVSAASEPTAVKGSASVENVDRFLNIGDSVDISKGYVTAMLSNGKPSRTILKNDMLKILTDEHNIQFSIFGDMQKRGWYSPAAAQAQMINETKTKFENLAIQL